MEKKYELLEDDSIVVDGHTLHRIKALDTYTFCVKGDLGGYIENETDLSHEGNCWVANNAKVYNCKIIDNALIKDNAVVTNSTVSVGSIVYNDAVIINSNIEDSEISGHAHINLSNVRLSRVYGTVDCSTLEYSEVYNATLSYANLKDCRVYSGANIKNAILACATIGESAVINSFKDYIVFKNHFSSGRFFTWTRSDDMWSVGCFYGTGEELIEKAYQDSDQKGKYYEAYVKFVEQLKAIDEDN